MMVENIANNEVKPSLVVDVLVIMLRNLKLELLSLEIYEDIPILGIIKIDKE